MLCFAASLAALAVAYLVAIDEVAGLFVDDGWYLVLARALASGRGFTLINAPVAGVLPFYPPGFPALLALVSSMAPPFPGDVPWLKTTSVVALLAATVVLRSYFVRFRGTSTLIASGLATTVIANPLMHFLLTSAVLSEGVFVLLQAAAIVAVERVARAAPGRRATSPILLAAALVAATTLVRSIGVVLAPAAVLAVLLRGRARHAWLLASAIVAFVVPWQTYAALHHATPAQQAIVNDVIAFPYLEHFGLKRAGHVEFGREGLADVPGRVATNLRKLATASLGTLFLNPLLERLTPRRGVPSSVPVAVSLALAALTLLGLAATWRADLTVAELYVAATVTLLLLYGSEANRYLLPLLPYLAFHALAGCAVLAAVAARLGGVADASTARVAELSRVALLVLVVGVNAAALARDVADTLGVAPGRRTAWRVTFAENLNLLAWVREHVPRDAVLATHNPGMVWLYTGNPTVGSWEGATNGANWRAAKARFWVDNTVAAYRFPDMLRSGLTPIVLRPRLNLGVYRIPPPGYPLR